MNNNFSKLTKDIKPQIPKAVWTPISIKQRMSEKHKKSKYPQNRETGTLPSK